MELREELQPPELDENRVEELVDLGRAIESQGSLSGGSRQPTELIDEYFQATGCLFGPMRFHSASSGEGMEALVRRSLMRPSPPPPALDRDEAVEILRRIWSLDIDDPRRHYWLELLSQHFHQRYLEVLIDEHDPDLAPDDTLSAEELVELAEGDDDLVDHLHSDPEQRWPPPPVRLDPAAVSRTAWTTAEALLPELSRRGEVVFSDDGMRLVGPVASILDEHVARNEQVERLIETMVSSVAVSEIYASDAQLAETLDEVATYDDVGPAAQSLGEEVVQEMIRREMLVVDGDERSLVGPVAEVLESDEDRDWQVARIVDICLDPYRPVEDLFATNQAIADLLDELTA